MAEQRITNLDYAAAERRLLGRSEFVRIIDESTESFRQLHRAIRDILDRSSIEHRERRLALRTRPGDGKVRKVRDRRARQLAHALQFVQPVPQRLGPGTVMLDGKVVGTVKEAWVSMPCKRRKKRKRGISWPMDPCIVQMAALLFGGKPR